MNFDEQEKYISIGEQLGKREMLLYIQRAALANGGNLSLKDINAYSQVCGVNEMIFETEKYESETQQSIREASIVIASGQIQ